MKKSLIIIPTYNEIDNIILMIETLLSISKESHILVVDDSSPDGTAHAVIKLHNKNPERVFLLERNQKRGLGTAYIDGFKWGLKKSYSYFFQLDCDFSHNPLDLIRLYDMLIENNLDLCIGSRYISGINVVNWPMSRVLLSWCASKYVRIITGLPVHDTTAGFVCYSRKALDTLDLKKIKFHGYAFQIEMKFSIWKLGFNLKEVPIIFRDRVRGTSKLNSGIIKEAAFGVIFLKVKSFFSTYAKSK